jgi:hypothetical protein
MSPRDQFRMSFDSALSVDYLHNPSTEPKS